MKTALITTTINVPKVLALYRKLGPEVRFFVAGDLKTPLEAADWCADLPGATYLSPEFQKSCNYKSSELIGWNTVRRRNIALLEALKWGADVIVTIDDDNIPINSSYFYDFQKTIGGFSQTGGLVSMILKDWPFSGLKVTSPSKWFDAGQIMIPQTPHRGFPYDKKAAPSYEPIVDAKIGVAAGLCLGDPDIDAVTRIATAPVVHGVSELARAGVVVDPKENWTVFNTQNTAFIRELAPAMFCAPGLGRFDDIVASLVTQRVMQRQNLHVHFGMPFVWQSRNPHNLIKDLEEEVWGMGNLTKIAQALEELCTHFGWSAVELCRDIWQHIPVPPEATECALAFLDDVETVL